MIKKSITIFSLFFLLFLLVAPVAYAEGNIIFSIPKRDYNFSIGEQAYIPLKITNSYNNDINGTLEHTITPEINSESFRFLSSNTKYRNLQIKKGNSTFNLPLVSSDKPGNLSMSLNFSYDENGSKVVPKVIPLDGIAIHFVENNSEKQNQANPVQSSSKEAPTTQQTPDPFAQQEQQTQQIMQQMMNEQMQKQVQQQQQTQQQSQQQIATNSDSQKYLEQPQDDGFKEVNSTYSRENNTTSLKIQNENSKNETAPINARFLNSSVKHIELVREEDKNIYPLYFIGILIALSLAFHVYNKYSGKKEQKTLVGENIPLREVNFDFREEAGKRVEKAISLYEVKQFKDAYGTAAQALRLYLSYKYGLKKEITNSELINYLKSKGVEYEKFDRCLQLSSLVEFAKHNPDDAEFEEMIKTIKNAMIEK